MPLQFLRLTNEATYGVFNPGSSLVKNTDYIDVQLTDNNPFTVRTKPKQTPIRSAAGSNRRIQLIGDKSDVSGSLMTPLYPEQTTFILNWATTYTSGELGSVTADYGYTNTSGAIQYRRFLGCKVSQLHLTSSATATEFKLNLDLIGQAPAVITVTDLPTPALSVYPQEIPWVFTNLSSPGFLNLGSGRSQFESLDVTFKNILDAHFYESQYVSAITSCGRDISFAAKLAFQSATDRTNYEANTPAACSFEASNGTNTITFTFNGVNYMGAVNDDFGLDKRFGQTLDWMVFLDQTAGSDFAFTYV